MAVKFEVTAITGKYTDRDGNEKNRYQKIGVVVESRNGPMLKMESVPLNWDGWAYLNEPKEREQSASGNRSNAPRQQPEAFKPEGDAPFADDIPFDRGH